jgi:hypothetical protein
MGLEIDPIPICPGIIEVSIVTLGHTVVFRGIE